MKWFRRFAYYLFAAAFAASALWYYDWSGKDPYLCPSPIEQLPEGIADLIVMPEPFKLASQSDNQAAYQDLHTALQWARSIVIPVKLAEEKHPWFGSNPMVFCEGANGAILLFGLPAGWSQHEQEQWLVKTLEARPVKSGLFSLATPANGSMLYLRIQNNICKVSEQADPPAALLTEASTATTQELQRAIEMGGKADLIQVQFKTATKATSSLLPPQAMQLLVRDLYLHNQHMIGEEILVTEEPGAHVSPIPADWLRLIPAEVEQLEAVGMASGYEIVEHWNAQALSSEEQAAWNGRLAELETAANSGAEASLGAWWNGGLGLMQFGGKSYALMGTADQQATLNGLPAGCESEATPLLNGTLLTWEAHPLLDHLLGKVLPFSVRAAWVLPQHLVLSTDREALLKLASRVGSGKVVSDSHALTRALQRDEHFLEYRQLRPNEATFEINGLQMPLFQSEEEENTNHYIRSGTYTATGKVVTRFDLSPAASAVPPASLVWENSLPAFNPRSIGSIKNHNNGEYYVVIQDLEHRLHALDARGRKMWTHPLDGPISSEVYSIDILGNNKFQVLVSTKGGIHCIDLLGRSVSGFPIRPSTGKHFSSPLLLVDYDNNGKYRFIIGQSDGRILNFDNSAKATRGWKKPAFESEAIDLAYLKLGQRDYLFVSMKNGELALLKRDGESRHKTSLRLPPYQGRPAFRLTSEISSSSVLVCDTSGQIIEGRFGNGERPQLRSLAEGIDFLLHDLDRDRYDDLILLGKTSIHAYGRGDEALFKRNLRSAPLSDLRTYQFAAGTRIGVVLPALGEVHLLEKDGSTADGFPLFGGGPCVIRDFSNDGKLELITTDGNGLILCYRL